MLCGRVRSRLQSLVADLGAVRSDLRDRELSDADLDSAEHRYSVCIGLTAPAPGQPGSNLLADPSLELPKARDQFGACQMGRLKYEGECHFADGEPHQLQRPAEQLAERLADWMPWNHRATIDSARLIACERPAVKF